MKKINSALFAIGFLALASCDEARGYDDYEIKSSPTAALNGEWFIDITDQGSGDVLAQHILHKTYDTGQNDMRMYIDDEQEGYYIKGKVTVDVNNLTFNTADE